VKYKYLAIFSLSLLAFTILVWPGVFIYDHDAAQELVRINRFTGTRQYSTDDGWRTMRDLEVQARDRILADVRRSARQGKVSSAVWEENVLCVRDPMGSENNAFFGTSADTAAVEATFRGTPVKLTKL